jgi:ankyrin repeat protein
MKKRGRLQPGSSDTSMIYLRVAGSDFGPQMPLTGELTPQQIALIKAWIDQGAEWPNALAGKEARPVRLDPAATAMIDAIRRGDAEALAALLTRHPWSTNHLGGFGATPLMVAALYGDVESARLLLRRGAKPNVANAARATPLMWAAGDEEMTRLLLDHRADPNAVNVDGVSPLLVAATRSGASATVKLLLDRGAVPPRAGDRRSKRPSLPGWELQEAAFGGDAAMFRLLMERGADAKAADDGGYGVLFAARTGCAPCLDVLIPAAGKDELSAALVPLAAHGDTPLLARLLDGGADVNAKRPTMRRDYRNRTPLMLAAGSDLMPLETVKLLVSRGAELDATGPEGETALDLARRHGPTPVVRYLEQAGARPGRSSPPPSLTPRPAASAREAVGRALPLLQRSDVRFVEKTGCFSCHNNTFTAMTVGAARVHGVPVDEPSRASSAPGRCGSWRKSARPRSSAAS